MQDVEMDLGVLEKSQATYMEFNAGGVVCDDLRLAYSKIMTEYEVYNEDEFEEMPDVSCYHSSLEAKDGCNRLTILQKEFFSRSSITETVTAQDSRTCTLSSCSFSCILLLALAHCRGLFGRAQHYALFLSKLL